MRVLNGFDASPGTKITVKVAVNAVDKPNISTFGGVLKRFDEDGGATEAQWTPTQLLAGVEAELGKAHGYDVIFLPVTRKDTNPSMTVSIDASSVGFTETDTEKVGDNVPFGYRIFMS
jgi:hypothetical protein